MVHSVSSSLGQEPAHERVGDYRFIVSCVAGAQLILPGSEPGGNQLLITFFRSGNEQCSWFGEHVFVFVVLFGVRILNVFGFVIGVFGVRCSGTVVLCSVFGSGVVFRSLFALPSSQRRVLMMIINDHHL